jgi:subtilisin family serine protease
VRSHDRALAAVGKSPAAKAYDYRVSLNGFAVDLTDAQALAMAQVPGVAMVLRDVMRYKQTDALPDFLGLDVMDGPWYEGYDGEGVVVGVIDTGVWPEHPSFADDGSYLPPPTGPLPCEFGNTVANPADAPFTCNNKLIGAYQMLATYRTLIGADLDEFDSARDDDGHGTHTASTAVGNAGVEATIYGIPRGTISGVAPRAHVIAYKALGNLGGFTSDLVAAIDQAVADGVDVINYSIGGGASVTGADDIAFLFAADAGVFVATSAGNSGPGPATIGGPSSVPWVTSVGASSQSRFFQGTVVLGNGAEYTGASVTEGTDPLPLVDAADVGNELCDPTVPFTGDITGKMVLCKRGGVGRVAKSWAVYLADGAAMVLYNAVDTDNLFTDNHWVPTVHIDYTPGLAIKSYIAGAGASATASIVGEQMSTWPYAPSMTIFSSRGPNPVAPDIIKPDITAPGLQILAGASPFTDEGFVPGELFQAIAGTSMSSPVVAGAYALLKQANPTWSAAAAKSALMTTAHQEVVDNDRTSPADPFDMGAGHLDIGGKVAKGTAFQPGLVYEAGFLEYLGFLCDEGPEVFANPTATCAFLESNGVPTEAENLNYPSIGISDVAGSTTVERTVTSVANSWRTYRVSVDAPEGFTVTVSPSSFRLKRGMSATYEVTVTNVSAPVDEWRFGSLTWRSTSGGYAVNSPIAVKGALFQAPTEISGSGVEGSASFDVKFGYTGSYTAGPHGLEPATVISDNVLQDPDQIFDPGDGFSDAHTFNLSGAAFFRVAIPPEATEADADLDVYVYDPTNTLVASSTLGGTDELVDILLPMDGTWTVYVHGWAAPGGDSDYDMSSWVISATPGGSLSLDSAPTSATMGGTGTIAVSWSGLAAGDQYLGAVSHTGPGGLMGLTLVEVET